MRGFQIVAGLLCGGLVSGVASADWSGKGQLGGVLARGVATETVWITDEELDARPELVKTMSVQPPRGAGRIRLLKIPDIDLQPCGGTHVANIAEIGGIQVLRIRNEGKRNKRVEIALTG